VTYICGRLTRRDNLNPEREGRTAPRALKRSGSNRYPRRPPDTPATRTVTYRIELHPLKPRPANTPTANHQHNPTMII
jgi:hypothetical protein